MKKILFILAFLAAGISNAQTSSAPQYSQTLQLTNTFDEVVFADSSGTGYFLTKDDKKNTFLEAQEFNSSTSKFSVKLGEEYNDFDFTWRTDIAEGIIFIGGTYDKPNGQLHLKYDLVNWKGDLKFPAFKEFLVISGNKKDPMGSRHFIISPNHSKFVISYRPDGADSMMIFGFNQDLNSLYTKTAHFYKNSKKGFFSASDFKLSDDGDFIYQSERVNITKSNGDWNSIEDALFIYRNGSSTVDSVILMSGDPKETHLFSYGFSIDRSSVISFGITIDGKYNQGTYFSVYDLASKRITANSNGLLTVDKFITPGALDKTKGKPNLPQSAIRIHPYSDGYYVVLDAGSAMRSQLPSGGISTMLTYYNCSILSFSTDGTLKWISTILRDHTGAVTTGQLGAFGISTSVTIHNDDFSLYGAPSIVQNNELTILMNDDPKNIPQPSTKDGLTPVRKPDQFQGCIVHISSEGKITKSLLTNAANASVRIHYNYFEPGHNYLYCFYDSGDNSGSVILK